MIKIRLTGRTGNQMFQFAFAYLSSLKGKDRILILPSSHFGYCLEMFQLPFLSGKFPPGIFLFINKVLSGICRSTHRLSFPSCFYSLQLPEIKGTTEIEGYFQDGKSYLPYRDELLKLFTIRPEISDRFLKQYGELLKKKILVLNVRLGNYKQAYFEEIKSHGLLSRDWYLKALEKIDIHGYDHFLVISDEIEEVKSTFGLEQYAPIYIDDDVFTDFQFMMHADCLILSNSSFSWWAAFLNERKGKRIIAPKNWVGHHVGVEYPSGILLEDWIQV